MQNKFKSEIYPPSEDTFFFADLIKKETGEKALDIGTGSGYLGKILHENFNLVIGTDLDFTPLNLQNPKLLDLVCCDSAEAFHVSFDLIICNMPYLPSDNIFDKTVDGGKEGIETPFTILKSAESRLKKGGKIIFLTSSLANYQKLLQKTMNLGFKVKIIGRKKLFFEELILVEALKIN